MEKHEVMKILVLIESVYPEFTVRDESVENWFTICRDLDYNQVMKNLSAHIRRSPYPPLMAEIAAFLENEQTEKDCLILEEEGFVQMKHDSLLPKQQAAMSWMNEYSAVF